VLIFEGLPSDWMRKINCALEESLRSKSTTRENPNVRNWHAQGTEVFLGGFKKGIAGIKKALTY